VDRVLLQCYAGGSGNNPCGWEGLFGDDIEVYPGIWTSIPATIIDTMTAWRNECCTSGGWLWLYDEFDNNPSRVQAAASAINAVFAPG